VLVGFIGALPIFFQVLNAAEYKGKSVDGKIYGAMVGETYGATAYSHDTGKYYDVNVQFKEDTATIHFRDGRKLTLSIDEDIEDPHNISGFDNRGDSWDLNVNGMGD
jgi:hypothetical protein